MPIALSVRASVMMAFAQAHSKHRYCPFSTVALCGNTPMVKDKEREMEKAAPQLSRFNQQIINNLRTK
jgi:hypothetical protein